MPCLSSADRLANGSHSSTNNTAFYLLQVSFASELLIPMNLYVALLILRSLYPPDYYPDRELNSFTKTNNQFAQRVWYSLSLSPSQSSTVPWACPLLAYYPLPRPSYATCPPLTQATRLTCLYSRMQSMLLLGNNNNNNHVTFSHPPTIPLSLTPYLSFFSVTKIYSLLGDSSLGEIGNSFCESLFSVEDILSCQDPLLDKINNGGRQGDWSVYSPGHSAG